MDNKKRFLRAVTGLRALVILLGFLTMTLTDASATTYYSVSDGDWTATSSGVRSAVLTSRVLPCRRLLPGTL